MKNKPKTDLRGSNREFKDDMQKAYKRSPKRKASGFGAFGSAPKKRPVGQPIMPQAGMPMAAPMQQPMQKKTKKKVSRVLQKKSRKISHVKQKHSKAALSGLKKFVNEEETEKKSSKRKESKKKH